MLVPSELTPSMIIDLCNRFPVRPQQLTDAVGITVTEIRWANHSQPLVLNVSYKDRPGLRIEAMT